MQKLLIVGGAGDVARLVLPYLQEQYRVRVFDLRPTDDTTIENIAGNVTDYVAMEEAMRGCDHLLYMAMGSKHLSQWNRITSAASHFDTATTGIYNALHAAKAAGVAHAVYASSMSVYQGLNTRFIDAEDMPPDAADLYGLSKRFGEEVCRAVCRTERMSVNALRLCHPRNTDDWAIKVGDGSRPFLETRADDVARALHLALQTPCGSFQAFAVCGDWQERTMRLTQASS